MLKIWFQNLMVISIIGTWFIVWFIGSVVLLGEGIFRKDIFFIIIGISGILTFIATFITILSKDKLK